MAKGKFKYNPETLSYDRIETGAKYYLSRLSLYTIYGAAMGALFFLAYISFIDSPTETKLERENTRLVAQYEIMTKKLEQVQLVLDDIQQRDENIYRVIYQADSIPNSVRRAGFGGVNPYAYLENMENAELVVATAKKLDMISKQLYVQSNSFDEIIDYVKRNEEMIRAIPAIQPVANKDLLKSAGGYGARIDPIYKIPKFHEGMDFTAPPGTDVYATADGTVERVQSALGGYGKNILINHGFGYTTIYGHLSEFNVVLGQKVSRGEVIGKVGSTGKSTGPHLHYEVRIKGQHVNPANYYFQDLTDEQYEKMINISSNSNLIFD